MTNDGTADVAATKRKKCALSKSITLSGVMRSLVLVVAINIVRLLSLYQPELLVDETNLSNSDSITSISSGNSFMGYRRRYLSPETAPILVLITHSERWSSHDDLERTVRDVLQYSKQATVFAYTSSIQSLELLQQSMNPTYRDRLVVHLTETMNVTELGADLVDDLNVAYMLDYAAQQQDKAPFTILLKAGMRLRNQTGMHHPNNFTSRAIEHYDSTASSSPHRVCLTMLSELAIHERGRGIGSGSHNHMPAFMIETAEHARRMAITLRSALPYRRMRARHILFEYCQRFLWNAKPIMGPLLFESSTTTEAAADPLLSATTSSKTFLNASQLPLPPWIDANTTVGPAFFGNSRYRIVFGAPTMRRPNNTTHFLEQFMAELIEIVETDFVANSNSSSSSSSGTSSGGTTSTGGVAVMKYEAAILLLVSGNSLTERAAYRQFLASTYQSAIARGILFLVDAPIESYPLQNLRLTFPDDSPQRRYWRSKQNLDVSSTFQAMAGLSEYVMLLEDDTGFQPGFAPYLKNYIKTSREDGEPIHCIPMWSLTEFGFGYSGLLLHSSDVIVYQRLHWTFYDELPCDNLDFATLVRFGRVREGFSSSYFSNRENSFLKHYGNASTLAGKSQKVW